MKLRSFLVSLGLLFGLGPALNAQSVSYNIDVTNLYYSENGCGDQSGTPDPRWRVRFVTAGLTEDYNVDRDNIGSCGWQNTGTHAMFAGQPGGKVTTNLPQTIQLQFNGWEDDGIFPDDANCGGYSTLSNINVCTYDPYLTHTFTSTRFCTSDGTQGEYRVQWRYKWGYNAPPTITTQPQANADLCIGNSHTLTVAVNNDNCGRSMGRFYKWQVSTETACPGTNAVWTDIPGATGPSLLVPQTPGTRIYRCLISNSEFNNFPASNTVISNCARVTYNPGPPPPIQSGICGNTILPGTSHTLNTLQPPAVGAIADLTGYTWSVSGGTLSSTSGPSVTWTAPNTPGVYTITVTYNDGCGNVISAPCSVTVGSPACDFIYVSPLGTDDITCGGPNNPCKTLTSANGALGKVSGSRNHIRMAVGNYAEPGIVTLQNNLVIEGRFEIIGNDWVKTSNTGSITQLNMSGIESVSGVRHRMGFRSNAVNNWKLIDLNITTTNNATTERDSSGRGASNYGVWIYNSSGYEISRCNIKSGNAGNGENGANGNNGISGANGQSGGAGGCSTTHCEAGDGGNSISGGAGGVSLAGAPANNAGANGGASGYGGAGGDEDNCGNATGNCVINRTSSTRNGARGNNGTNGSSQGLAIGGTAGSGACGATGNIGGTGDTGYAGTNGANGTDGITSSPTFTAGLFVPGNGTFGTGGAGGGGGGGGGGGAWRSDCWACDDDSGSGGGSGGAGGGGGSGGAGGKGGGATFALYTFNSPSGVIFNSTFQSGTSGSGGIGGNGGLGGNGGTGGTGLPNCENVGSGGNGGAGGKGGNGGKGGDGAAGLSYAIANVLSNGTFSSSNSPTITPAISVNSGTSGGSIPNSPIVNINTYNSKICANSVINIEKNSGNWALPTDFFYVPYNQNSIASQFNNSSANADIYTTNTSGYYDLVAGGVTFKSYLSIEANRTLNPIRVHTPGNVEITSNPIICNGGSVKLSANPFGTQVDYKWELFADTIAPNKGSGTPYFSSTLQSPTTPSLPTGEYIVRYQVREECCGWSIPVFKRISVKPDPSAPTNFTINPNDTVCVPGTITASNPTGATNGVTPYTYIWDYENASHPYGAGTTSTPSFASTLGQNKVSVYIQANSDRGCDASPTFEKMVFGIEASTPPTSITGTTTICAGDTTYLNVNGGTLGFGADAEWFTGGCGGTLIGTGSSIAVNPSTTTTYYVRYKGKCNTTSCISITVTVNALPTTFTPTITTSLPLCYGGNAQVTINPSQTGTTYQLFNGTSLIGSPVSGNGGSISLLTNNLTAASNNFQVIATNTASSCTTNTNLSTAITVSGPPTALAMNGDSRTCYINGNNAPVEFTVGNRGIASLNPGTQNLGYVTITEYVNATPINTQACNTSPVNQPQFTTAALNRHWLISSTVAPTNASTIRLYIDGTDVTNLASVANANANPNDDIIDINSLELSKYSGPNENDQWNDNCSGTTTLHFQTANGPANGAIVGGTGIVNGQYVSFSIPSFSELWLSGTSNTSPLPIILGKFEAECNKGKVDLRWTTVSETNNDKFIIERSADGNAWNELLFVQGAGNSNQPLNYMTTDLNPIRGLSYYRLKQVDYNGASEIFTPVSIICLSDGENSVLIYPNPASESFTVQFNSEKAYSNAEIELMDMTGRVVGSKKLDIQAGNNSYTYTPLTQSAGTYTVRIKSKGETIIQAPLIIHKY